MKEEFLLWDNAVSGENFPTITHYKAFVRSSNATVVIFPGGGYAGLSPHEGEGYAQFFNIIGMDAFVVKYRVAPNRFPIPLLDARRAVRFVRANAEKFNIDPNKVAVMGSSAGGHLSALISTYRGEIAGEGVDEIDGYDYLPNAQILCYPVICMHDRAVSHIGSNRNLLGEDWEKKAEAVSPDLIADDKTPPAFIWHTSDDEAVNVVNSLRYAEKLHSLHIPTELIVYPHGGHGEGVAPAYEINRRWTDELDKWLGYIGFINRHY